MSEGPIKRERAAWEPPRVTTRPAEAVHAFGKLGRTYCGRNTYQGGRRTLHSIASTDKSAVTCSDCLAALAADAESDPKNEGDIHLGAMSSYQEQP